MKRIFTLLCFLFTITFLHAQWVSIPDNNFGAYLTTNFPNCMQGDPLVGYQMDITCSDIVFATTVDCAGLYIADLTGIEYFTSLKTLYCLNNTLTSLPTLPNSIEYLDCSNNQLFPSILSLPSSLRDFNCSNNGLQSIAISSAPVLRTLNCTNNNIMNLDNMSDSIESIDCSNNWLLTLTNFSARLTTFNCSDNSLNTFPPLPLGLTDLIAYNNQLDSLPALPASLRVLGVSNNHITHLGAMPSLLEDLLFGNNLVSQMPVLPNTLKNLDCSVNNNIALPVHLPDSLKLLFCYSNQLTALPNLPSTLYSLDCSANNLTSLPTLPTQLYTLYCANNNIVCLPKLPTSLNSFYFQGNTIQCLPNRINPKYFDTNPSTLPLCDLTSGCPFYYNIEGNAHQKMAANCVADSITPGNGLHNIKVLLEEHNQIIQQVYTDNSGNYSFDIDSLTRYTVKVDSAGLPFTIACPSSYSYTDSLTIYDSVNQQKNFGLACKGNSDFAVGYVVSPFFRPATTQRIQIGVGNLTKLYYNSNCGNGSSGTVVVSFSGAATYVGPAAYARTPTTISGNTFTYVVSNLDSVQYGDFDILIHVDTFATINSDICITATVFPTLADLNPANNTQTECVPIRNSHDPNVKDVYPKTMTQTGGWLTYTIHFQNTGNDTAKTVVVKDTLPQLVQPETFSYLGSSHNPGIQIKANIVTFTFSPIDLVDSATNEALSHGWIQFKVKTKNNLPSTFSIVNNAAIYFDLNSAIYTNDAITNTCTNTYSTIYDSICAGYSYVFAGKNQTVGGVYYDTLSNVLGCDSFIDLHLFIKQKSTAQIFDSICQGSSRLFNGVTLTQAGVYADTLVNAAGCDSLVTLTLTIKSAPVLPVIQRAANRLVISSTSGYAYQWKLNGQPISGQNDTAFTFAQNGNYTVEVTSPNQCTALSSVYTLSNVGFSSLQENAVLLYPNPNAGQFTIQIPETFIGGDIVITNVLGQNVFQQILNNAQDVITLEHAVTGIYIAKLTKGDVSKTLRLIVQQR
jgi:uncharacterized repeat protein (TIGR01451 family)